MDDRNPGFLRRLGERLDNALRLVEVPVLGAERRALDAVRHEARDELGRLCGRDELRRDAKAVLQRDVIGEAGVARGGVGDEEVATLLEPGLDGRFEPVREPAVERDRLDRELAADASAPLLTHPAGLDTGGFRPDSRPLVDDDVAGRPLCQMPGDREARDAGADDRDVDGRRGVLSNILHGFADIDGLAFSLSSVVLRRQPERDFAEAPVTSTEGWLPSGVQLLAHAAGPVGILERLGRTGARGRSRFADRGDQLVTAADRSVRIRPPLVPGQDVREHDVEPEPLCRAAPSPAGWRPHLRPGACARRR